MALAGKISLSLNQQRKSLPQGIADGYSLWSGIPLRTIETGERLKNRGQCSVDSDRFFLLDGGSWYPTMVAGSTSSAWPDDNWRSERNEQRSEEGSDEVKRAKWRTKWMDGGGSGAVVPGRGRMREQREWAHLRGCRWFGDDCVSVGRGSEREFWSDRVDVHVCAERQAGQFDVRRPNRSFDDGRRWVIERACGRGDRAFDEGEVNEQRIEIRE